MKIFVVTEISFEYNDEYYYQGESEGGKPVTAYSTKEKAKEAIPELTKQWILDNSESDWMSIAEFGGYNDAVLNLDYFASEAGLDLKEVEAAFETYDARKINPMVKDNIDAAVKAFNLTIFKVTEIELNETVNSR